MFIKFISQILLICENTTNTTFLFINNNFLP